MLRKIIVISFILFSGNFLGYSQDNPFDIFRQDTVKLDEQGRIVNRVDHLNNPFDVEHIPYVADNNFSAVLPTRSYKRKKVKQVNPVKSLPFWVLVLSFIILAITININRSTFVNMYKALTNDNFMKLLKREEKNGNTSFFYLLYLLFALNLSLFVWLAMGWYEYGVENVHYFYILGGILGIYLVRHISLYLIGKIFPLEKEASFFSFLIVILNGILGVILLIFNVFIEYSPLSNAMIYISIGLILVLYILRNLKGIGVLMGNSKIGLFHFFIYLCTFEIAPNLVIWSYLCNNTINF